MNDGLKPGFTDVSPSVAGTSIQIVNASIVITAVAPILELELTGGGGGGQNGGYGGASAGYAFKRYEGLTPGVTQITIIIGANGTPGASPTSGGQSSVAIPGFSTVTCTGGDSVTPLGGVASNGDININGQIGGYSAYAGSGVDLNGGAGASTPMGLGGAGGSVATAGRVATGAGAGGGGGGFLSAGSIAAAGAVGAAGRAILKWSPA